MISPAGCNQNQNNKNNNNNNDENHQLHLTGEQLDDPEGQILLRQVDDGKMRPRRHRSTSACQLDMTAISADKQAPNSVEPKLGPQWQQYLGDTLPTISIAIHNQSTATRTTNAFREQQEYEDEQLGHSSVRSVNSNSTTSDVNSEDDAASIASRLSQIVDEQEFLMINKQQDGRRDGVNGKVVPSLSMGNLLLANDSKFQRHKTGVKMRGANLCEDHKLASRDKQQEARSASVLVVNRLIDTRDSVAISSHDDTSFHQLQVQGTTSDANNNKNNNNNNNNNSDNNLEPNQRVRTKSFAGQGAARGAQAQLGQRRNESFGSLYAERPSAGQCLPERGDLRLLESSRQQAHLAASRLRSESVGGGGGGGDGAGLMLNIRRSAWKLDEFEQAFNARESTPNERAEPEVGGGGHLGGETPADLRARSTCHQLFNSFRKVVGGGASGLSSQVSRDNKHRRAGPTERVATTPDGSCKLTIANKNKQQQQQHQHQHQHVLDVNLLNQSAGLGNKRRLSSHSSGNLQVFQQQQQQQHQHQHHQRQQLELVGAKNHTILNAATAQPRRGSLVSLSSFASSLDSSRSEKPFGRLGELLAPSYKRKRQKNERVGDYGDTPSGLRGRRGSESNAASQACCWCSLGTLKKYFPVLEWLPAYRWRDDFWPDLTAGLAVAVLNISTSLSAAVVAETDLGVAFRSSIVNTLVYALLCSSRHTSFGSWSIMSQMLLDSVRGALSDQLILSRINLGPQAYWSNEEYETWHMNIIIMYTFLIGAVQLTSGLLNLGNLLASFIPEALCSSMIAATAFTMAIGQLANMCGTSNKILWAVEKNTTLLSDQVFGVWSLGLDNSRVSITDLFAGLFRWIQQIALLVKHYEQINLTALIISFTCVLLLALNQYYLQDKLRHLFKKDNNLFLPFEMILMLVWIVISYALDLPGDLYRVTTCGPIEMEFGLPNLPNLRLVRELWFDSLATALISYTMVFIMARTYSNKLNYEIDNNQELVACGAGNLVGGLFDALPATASFSRTAGQVEAGGQTQMASLINCLALTLIVKFFGHHVAQLPVCVMAATLFFGFARMMTRSSEVLIYWRICKVDFAIWCVTFTAILTLDLVTGFVYGFIFSILTMLYRAQNRRCYLLGTIGSSADVFVPLAKYPLARELDSIKIFQFCGPIHYVCADLFERLLRQKTRVNVKEILKQMEQQQQQQQQQVATTTGISKQVLFDTINGVRTTPYNGLPTHIILDFSMISFIDSAGIHVIKKIIVDYQRINITIMLASLASHVAQVVKSEPSLWDTHKGRFYVTLADAVHHAICDSQKVARVSCSSPGDTSAGNNLQSCPPPPPPPPLPCTINKP